jgi:nucleotide-binding universal stress UspA family protein
LKEQTKSPNEISTTPKRILIPTDGSENAARAASVAIEYARKFEAEVFVLHVIAIPARTLALVEGGMGSLESSETREYFELARQKAKTIVDGVVKSAEARDVNATGLIIEHAFTVVETIVDQATNYKIDLIVMGTRGLTGFKKLLIGSVSSGVVNHAHCPVLVIR